MTTVTVIVPAHNAAETLADCLKALLESSRSPDEVIVYDDASTDVTAEIAKYYPVKLISTGVGPVGPATGRNRGAAAAKGDILVFVDADVVVHPNAIDILVTTLKDNADLCAAFGSYDDRPRSLRLAALYANLRHHYMHQHGERRASTFWCGLGVVWRTAFLEIGGFNPDERFRKLEDVEFGSRLNATGLEVQLVPHALGTHCKDWRLLQLWRTDIFDRAVPWSYLVLNGSAMSLNLSPGERIRACLAGTTVAMSAIGFFAQVTWLGPVCLAAYAASNASFLKLMYRVGRTRGLLGGLVLHFCYYIYSSACFAVIAGKCLITRNANSQLQQQIREDLPLQLNPK